MVTGIPVRAEYVVDLIRGQGYVVRDLKGTRLTDPSPFRMVAERARDEMQRAADKRAKRGPRPCMNCRAIFDSEGMHNRLCIKCRGHKDMLGDPQRPFIGRSA
jgi:hypothetical protein